MTQTSPAPALVGEAEPGAGLSPQEYASMFTSALAVEDLGRLRSAQTDGGVLGASDAGQCVHKAVLTVRRTPPSDVPKKGKAQIGTYLHEGSLRAVQALFPHKLIEQGQGGSIPLCNVFQATFPDAEILLIGVEEPRCLIHAPNESVAPSEIQDMALVEALFLQNYAERRRPS